MQLTGFTHETPNESFWELFINISNHPKYFVERMHLAILIYSIMEVRNIIIIRDFPLSTLLLV